MNIEDTFPTVLFHVLGVPVRDTVVVTWVIMLGLFVLSFLGVHRLKKRPGWLQNAMEAAVESVESLIQETTPFSVHHFVPFIGTLAAFLVIAAAVSTIPKVGSPTKDLSTTTALAAIAFFSVHFFALRLVGAKQYLSQYLEPHWVLLPFNIIGELTRTIALALRLFGNMLSGELVVAVLLLLAGFLVPVPMQLLGLLIGLIQAYVFTLLVMVYIAAALRGKEGARS